MEKIILTGDRPTGRLHIGHYVGSLRRRVELQNSGEYDKIFIMIADAQALTDNFDNPEKIRQNIIEVALEPGEEKTYIFVLGYVENPVNEKWVGHAEDGIINRAPADALLARFDTTEKADAALAELKAYWDKLLGHFSISSSEEKLDRMVNVWHQYQCMVTFNMSRSASYFESGIGRGMGFRDSCQDLLFLCFHTIPSK